MYKYIHTTSSVITRGKKKDLIKDYVSNYLFSLYYAFTVNSFGFDSVDRFAINKVRVFYENLYKNEELFIDSGGYSIIVGDVNPRDVQILIDCYHYFAENYKDIYHKILSLDIPVFLNYPQYNNIKTIYDYNYTSISKSKEMLKNNKDLYDKYIFVWHFKIKKQFEIWKNLYNEFFEDDYNLNKFAIGGLVGLRGTTGIKFSPFIVPIYRILKAIEKRGNLHDKYLIHILGVYGLHDRLTMQFMEKLINNYYFKNNNFETDISYDTINYQVSGFYKSRHFPLFEMFNCNPLKSPKDKYHILIKRLFKQKNIQDELMEEIERILGNKEMKDMEFFSLTYTVYSQILDWSMKKFIDNERILEIFLECKNFNILKNKLLPIFNNKTKNYPFSLKGLRENLLSNFFWLSNLHLIWENDADMNRIDKGIEKFIEQINFPADLDN
ncbi:MAG: hypothetical protein ACOC1O_02045 [bacterium]